MSWKYLFRRICYTHILTFILMCTFTINAQSVKINKISQTESGLSLSFFTNAAEFITESNGKLIFNYNLGMEEDSPGKPMLPGRNLIIAIPPYSKLSFDILNKQEKILQKIDIKVSPEISFTDDSTILYNETNVSTKYLENDIYPTKQIEVLGYTWVRDFYCAIIRLNPYQYQWKSKSISMIDSAEIKITFDDVVPFLSDTEPLGEFDKDLKDVIINFESAQNFRSKNKSRSIQDSTANWIDYSKTHYKLGIVRDGIQRITVDNLISYGITPSLVNPKTIKIFRKGEQLPLFIKGEDDLSFDQADYIEFWCEKNYGSPNYKNVVQTGQDYLNYMDRYSDTTIVWLTFGGNDGRRIEIMQQSPSVTADTIKSHLSKKHFEQDIRLWYYDAEDPRTQLPFWQEHKVFTWLTIGNSGSQRINFIAKDFVLNTPVTTTVRLISNAGNTTIDTHKHGSSLNSTIFQDSISFNYRETVNFTSTFSSNQLLTGSNAYRVFGLPTSATFHRSLIDWVDIEYFRENNTQGDSLLIVIPDSVNSDFRNIRFTNLQVDDSLIILYKVSEKQKKILAYSYSNGELVFSDSVKGGDKYIIIKPDYLVTPVFKYSKDFINLRDQSRGADYIIITHKSLSNSVQQYEQFVSDNYAVRTELIYIDDIYDEFAFGQNWAESIKGFLYYANQNWTAPSPSYLNLIGDANYDYKDIWNPAPSPRKKNLVPSYGNPVSDVWYTMWDSTNFNIPQMYVGRIPVNSNDELLSYLNKHSIYLNRRFDDWNKRYTFYSGGDPTKPSELAQIKAANDSLYNNFIKPFPIGGKGIHFYKTITPPTNFGPYTLQEIQNAVDSSGLFISYIGHSGTRTWDNGITEVGDIKNNFPDRYPLISDFGCSTGKFAEPDVDAFGELFVAQSSNGQAIGYLGNSSLGYLSTSLRYPGLFYKKILLDSTTTISKAHYLAKLEQFNLYGFGDVNRVFNFSNILFNDPLLQFALPEKPNFIINQNSVSLNPSQVSDLEDSVLVTLTILNWGNVVNDSLKVSITNSFADSVIFAKNLMVACPIYSEQIQIYVTTMKLVGQHNLLIALDSENLIDEIYEDDNSVNFNFQVFSSSIRPVETEYYYTTLDDTLTFLNPTYKTEGEPEEFLLSVSDNPEFNNAIENQYTMGSLYTKLSLGNININERYWYRARLNTPQVNWSSSYSFKNIAVPFKWFIDADYNENDLIKRNIEFDAISQSWKISRRVNSLKITSAGSNDGKFASMLFNAQEYLPNTFFWGISTAEIDSLTLEPTNIKYFSWPNSLAQNSDSLRNYILSLPEGKLLAMTISDDGVQLVLGSVGSPVRQAIKTLGSLYVDSVLYRQSWCIFGKKGAAIGSVPESYKKLFQGAAIIDSSKLVIFDEGEITFPATGRSAGWINVVMNDSIPDGSAIEVFPIGIRQNNQVDTLTALTFVNDSSSIGFIDPVVYDRMKLTARLSANDLKESPSIYSIGIDYIQPSELAINYQVVNLDLDSVYQGRNINLSFNVSNVGFFKSDSFVVSLDLIKPDKQQINLMDTLISNLNPSEMLLLNYTYKSNLNDGYGNMQFKINLDRDNLAKEIYEDNNIFAIPFYVIKDTTVTSVTETTVTVTFDGVEILDGDYTSSSPNISINFNYPLWFPIDDTSAVKVYLDDNELSYSDFDVNYDTINRIAKYNIKPPLSNGDHNLKVFGKDINGVISPYPGFEKFFVVSNEFTLLNLYNYPNPFGDNTTFTFILPLIPEELKISIYTIAGRKIKEFKKTANELVIGFNRIEWNGTDEDGDEIANGSYLYKVMIHSSEKSYQLTQKFSKVK